MTDIIKRTIEQLERVSECLASIGATEDYSDIAIQALEQESCEDCISRTEAIENFASWYGYDYNNQGYYRLLKQMPSVTPSYNSIKTELKPCEDAISREDAIDLVNEYQKGNHYEFLINKVKALPSVKPQPKTGHWITTRTFMHDGEFYCDKCKCDSPNNEKWDYCPNCGAYMAESEE